MTTKKKPLPLTRARALQLAAGAAQASQVEQVSSDTARSYLLRLDDAYQAMSAAINDLTANRPPKTQAAWTFINAFVMLRSRWELFFVNSKDDLWISDDQYTEAQSFARELEKVRKGYKKALGEAPPGAPELPVPQKDLPGALDSAATVVKWGVIGYLAIQAANLFAARSKTP